MIAVRPVGAADEAAWRPLWRAYLAFYGTTRPEEVFAATFARLTDPRVEALNGLLAEDGGAVVGLVHYIYHLHGWQTAEVCYLQDLYVAPEARGTGAGRTLIQAVYDAADRDGRPSVYWLTQAGNAEARRLYDRIGTVTDFLKYAR